MDNDEANFLLCVCVDSGSSVGGLGSSSFTLIHSFHEPLLFLKATLLPVQDPEKMIQLGRPLVFSFLGL